MKPLLSLALICLTVCFASLAYAEPSNVHEAADFILRQNGVTPEFASDPANQEIIAKIRRLAKAGNLRSRRALLQIGDLEITDLCLERLRAKHWFDSLDAAEALGASGQLGLIALLGSDLNTEESAQPTTLHSGEENFSIRPVSILATQVMRWLIVNSTEFRPEVKEWATHLEKPTDRNLENARAIMRIWWSQNESLLRTKQYAQVQPPN
jgi:uncharacterized protein YjiS (DUF1127 family)